MKARSFALALSYYFSDKFSVSGAAAVEGEGLWETGSVDDSDGQEVSAGDEDRWALQYLGVPHLQQIVEAADDDGAGYVSIHEVNEFARRRPEDWRFVGSPFDLL